MTPIHKLRNKTASLHCLLLFFLRSLEFSLQTLYRQQLGPQMLPIFCNNLVLQYIDSQIYIPCIISICMCMVFWSVIIYQFAFVVKSRVDFAKHECCLVKLTVRLSRFIKIRNVKYTICLPDEVLINWNVKPKNPTIFERIHHQHMLTLANL